MQEKIDLKRLATLLNKFNDKDEVENVRFINLKENSKESSLITIDYLFNVFKYKGGIIGYCNLTTFNNFVENIKSHIDFNKIYNLKEMILLISTNSNNLLFELFKYVDIIRSLISEDCKFTLDLKNDVELKNDEIKYIIIATGIEE